MLSWRFETSEQQARAQLAHRGIGNLGINFGGERGNAMVYFETESERFRFAQGKKGKFLRVQTGLRTFRSWPLSLTGLRF